MVEKYRYYNIIKLYDGEEFTTKKQDSEYAWHDGLRISDIEAVANLPVKLDLGNDNYLTIKPSDVLYIRKIQYEIDLEEEKEIEETE